jgi:hypothetical protein
LALQLRENLAEKEFMPLDAQLHASEFEPAIAGVEVCERPMYSLPQRIRSGYHAFWYRLGERLQWSRGIYREQPIGCLSGLTGVQQARVAFLGRRYAVRFERQFEQATALRNYDYLDILDQAWSAWWEPRPVGGVMHDVGSSNFWYARALHTFFRPMVLFGIEVEGHRIYRNGYSRVDYAQGYIEGLHHTRFIACDYRTFEQPADVVTAWFPFVTPAPVLAWRLPLSILTPHALFTNVANNLRPNGLFVMVNQGGEEMRIAATLCTEAGLEFQAWHEVRSTLRPRTVSPVVTWWRLPRS